MEGKIKRIMNELLNVYGFDRLIEIDDFRLYFHKNPEAVIDLNPKAKQICHYETCHFVSINHRKRPHDTATYEFDYSKNKIRKIYDGRYDYSGALEDWFLNNFIPIHSLADHVMKIKLNNHLQDELPEKVQTIKNKNPKI